MTNCFKIAVNLPLEFLEEMMDAVTASIQPLYPGYDRCFCYWPVTGTWRPLEDSSPFNGTTDEICVAPEMRLEFAVAEEYLEEAVKAVRRVHPYEEPAIDVIPMIPWKDVIPSDDR